MATEVRKSVHPTSTLDSNPAPHEPPLPPLSWQQPPPQPHAQPPTTTARPQQQCPFVTRGRLLLMLVASMSFTLVLVAHCTYPATAPAVFYVCWTEQRRKLQLGIVATSPSKTGPPKPEDRLQSEEEEEETPSPEDSDEVGDRSVRRRLPQCLIIGVRKGGTRALLEFLNLHPAIRAHKSEVHFFDDDHNYSLGLDWYRRRMPHSRPDQITVEKTPAYFVQDRVPSRVRRMNASARLLLIVRDPVDRAISDYMQIHSMRLSRGKGHVRFEDLAVDPVTGEIDCSYKAIERSIYHLHMAEWLRRFPLDQFHFVSGENLVRNPMAELRKVERFLGIDHKLSRRQFYFNKTRGFYCMRAAAQQKNQEKCLASSKGRTHPDISPNVTAKLRRFFAPHNLRFYDMVGLDFGWNSS